jgi:hypothetical protein
MAYSKAKLKDVRYVVCVEMCIFFKTLRALARGSGGGWGRHQEAPCLADKIARDVSTRPDCRLSATPFADMVGQWK